MNNESYGWALVIIILLLVSGGMMMGRGYMGIGMGFGFVLMALFWLAVIWLIFGLASSKSDKKKPIEILEERYVKGEIQKKQFEQMKKKIQR
ncbi:MAG: SHOCT domain-containing protein [Nanoarchaeota archaeon]|mgnify:CR=1 FL=1